MINSIKTKIPESFFKDEERCNYYISEKMKKVWAVQLDLLSELKRVCEKHGLTYFADSGTLLGAVRHKGYIPWDDDIDIAMKREDYDKLIKIGPSEFKDPFFLQSAHAEVFPRGYARLRNSNTTALTKYDCDKNINCGIFIDIFPLDNLPDDLNERKNWLNKIKRVYEITKAGCSKKTKEYSGMVHSIKFYLAKVIFHIFGYKKLIMYYERLCAKYNSVDTQKISYVAYSIGKEKHIWDRNCFEAGQVRPFEFTEIIVPIGYDSRLRVEYKDYMQLVRAPNTHGTMIIEPEIPYKKYKEEHSLRDIQKMLENLNSESV